MMRTLACSLPDIVADQTLVSGSSEDTAFLFGYTPFEDATTQFLVEPSCTRQVISCVVEDLAATLEIPGLATYRTLADAQRLYWFFLGRLEAQHISYGKSLLEPEVSLGKFLYATFCSQRPHYAALLEPYLFPRDQWRYCQHKD